MGGTGGGGGARFGILRLRRGNAGSSWALGKEGVSVVGERMGSGMSEICLLVLRLIAGGRGLKEVDSGREEGRGKDGGRGEENVSILLNSCEYHSESDSGSDSDSESWHEWIDSFSSCWFLKGWRSSGLV